jgi:hypothetical protein
MRRVRLLVRLDAMHTRARTAKPGVRHVQLQHLMIGIQPGTLAQRMTTLSWRRVPVAITDAERGEDRTENAPLRC